jgi:diguanylate cyclase (GGDEF)-like protein
MSLPLPAAPAEPCPHGALAVAAARSRAFDALLRSTAAMLSIQDTAALLAHFSAALAAAVPEVARAWLWLGPANATALVLRGCGGTAAAGGPGLGLARTAATAAHPVWRGLAGDAPAPWAAAPVADGWPAWDDDGAVAELLALPLAAPGAPQTGVLLLGARDRGVFDGLGLDLFTALAALGAAVLARQAMPPPPAAARPVAGSGRQAWADWAARLAASPVAWLLAELDGSRRLADGPGAQPDADPLAQAAATLQAALRQGDLLLHWRDEVFLIGLPGADASAACRVADKLRLQAATLTLPGEPSTRAALSIGLAAAQPGEPPEAALARAEAALSSARRSGRNRVVAG